MSATTLLTLIDAIYSAASDPSQWPCVARQIQSAIGGHSVNLVVESTSDDRFTCVYTNGVPEQEVTRYQTDIKQSDALTGLMNQMPEGTAFMTQDYFSMEGLHSLSCYDAFYENIGYTFFNVGVFHQNGDRRGWISVVRSEQDAIYTPEDQMLMQALIPHLRRAFLLNAQLLEARLSSSLALDALDHIEAATALISPKGHVIHHNHRAEAYLYRPSSTATEHLLRLPDSAANLELHRLIHASSHDLACTEKNVITFTDKGTQKIALCFPWQTNLEQLDWLGDSACCIVFILSPNSNTDKGSLLQQTFDLSGAEVKVLKQLIDGKSVPEVAEVMFISEATVRFHIRNLLRKTSSRNQADMMINVFKMVGVGIQ